MLVRFEIIELRWFDIVFRLVWLLLIFDRVMLMIFSVLFVFLVVVMLILVIVFSDELKCRFELVFRNDLVVFVVLVILVVIEKVLVDVMLI